MFKWLKQLWNDLYGWLLADDFIPQPLPSVEEMEREFNDYPYPNNNYTYSHTTTFIKPVLSNLRHAMRRGRRSHKGNQK